jgi:hypothetical protein
MAMSEKENPVEPFKRAIHARTRRFGPATTWR